MLPRKRPREDLHDEPESREAKQTKRAFVLKVDDVDRVALVIQEASRDLYGCRGVEKFTQILTETFEKLFFLPEYRFDKTLIEANADDIESGIQGDLGYQLLRSELIWEPLTKELLTALVEAGIVAVKAYYDSTSNFKKERWDKISQAYKLVRTSTTLDDSKFQELFDLLRVSSETVIVSKYAKEAFKTTYSGKRNVVEPFVSFLDNQILKEYNPKKNYYHSLYLAIVQSSGWGKSRFLLTAGKEFLNLVYGNLSEDEKSYPSRNINLLHHLETIGDFKEKLETFICCIYFEAFDRAEKLEKEKVAHQILHEEGTQMDSSGAFFSDFWAGVISRHNDIIKSSGEKRGDLIKRYRHHQRAFDKFITTHQDEILPHGIIIEVSDPDASPANSGSNEPAKMKILSELIVVFDEARVLLPKNDDDISIFHHLRKAQQKLESSNLVLSFVDTISRLSNFHPQKHLLPSFRRTEDHHHLLPPFYEIRSYDCLFLNDDELDLNSLEHLDRLGKYSLEDTMENLKLRLKRGRPLWPAEVLQNTVENGELVTFAMMKITCTSDALLLENMLGGDELWKIAPVISAVAIRFGVEGIYDQVLGEAITSRHMGTLLHVGELADHMTVGFPPEPALSEAACQLLHTKEKVGEPVFSPDRMRKVIEKFGATCIDGLVDAGDLGELSARFLLGLTYDECILKQDKQKLKMTDFEKVFSHSITVETFLEALFPEAERLRFEKAIARTIDGIDDDGVTVKEDQPNRRRSERVGNKKRRTVVNILEFKQKKRFMKGRINSTTYMKYSKLPTGVDLTLALRNAYHLGSAIIAPNCQKGTDIIIPVYLGEGHPLDQGAIMGMILIQVKDIVTLDFMAMMLAAGANHTMQHVFSPRKKKVDASAPPKAAVKSEADNRSKEKLVEDEVDEKEAEVIAPEPVEDDRGKDKLVAGEITQSGDVTSIASVNTGKDITAVNQEDDESNGDLVGEDNGPALYVSVLLDLKRDGFIEKMTVAQAEKLRDFYAEYPNHVYLPGLDLSSVVSGKNQPIAVALNTLRSARVDRIQLSKRRFAMSGMHPSLAIFENGCSCGGTADEISRGHICKIRSV